MNEKIRRQRARKSIMRATEHLLKAKTYITDAGLIPVIEFNVEMMRMLEAYIDTEMKRTA